MASVKALEEKLANSPGLRRVGSVLLLVFVGWLDYFTGPEIAVAPLYILALLPIAFFEPLWICLVYSVLAALIYLGADLVTRPDTLALIYPYWRAFARFFSFALISSTISQLLGERRRLRDSERALLEKARESEEKNRYLGELLGQVKRLQEELLAKERRAAIAETVHLATYEMERPLVSISVHVEDLLRWVKPHEDIYPLVEKIGERVRDMEGILKNIRDVRKVEGG
jgi:signal transduction histidine kinase